MSKIVLNGKEYDGIEAMPPDVRKDYEAVLESLKNTGGDEVLSLLEQGDRTSIKATFHEIVVNGKKYGSVEEMPADVRRGYERAVASLGSAAPPAPPPPPPSEVRPARPSRPVPRPPPRVEERRGWGGRIWWSLFCMALGAALALWVVRRWHLQL